MSGAAPAERAARLLRRLCAGTVLAAAVLLALAAPASAHAVFVSASPAAGASLAAAPAQVRIVFSEPLVPALSGVEVDDGSGARVATPAGYVDPADRDTYVQPLPRLGPARYTVVWHTTSAIDGHARWGSYPFTVLEPDGGQPAGAPLPRPATPEPLPAAVTAVTSWAGLAALFVITGATLVLLLGGIGEDGERRLFARLLVAALGGTAVATAGQFASTWAATGWHAAALTAVLGDGAAGWWWLRPAAALAALLAWPRTAARDSARRRVVLGAASLALATAVAAAGHLAAAPQPVVGVAFAVVHVLAASVWLGGVLAVALVWLRSRRGSADAALRRSLVRRFSVVAGMAVPAVLASGMAAAVLELGGIGDLTGSGYGRTLLVKAGLVAIAGVVAAGNARSRPPRALRAEAVLGLLVLVPTATLSVLGPASAADVARAAAHQAQRAADPASAFTGFGTLGNRGVEVALTPATTGVNAVRVEMDGDVATARLRVSLAGPAVADASLARTGLDHDPATHTVYQGSVALPAAGRWRVTVAGPAGTSAPIPVPVRAAASNPAQPPSGLDGWLLLLAVLGGTGVLVGAARAVRSPRWRRLAVGAAAACCVGASAGVGLFSAAAAPPLHPASTWGTSRQVTPLAAGGVRRWPVGAVGAGLMMPAVAPDGSVWIGEMTTGMLARLDPDAGVVRQVAVPSRNAEIMGVAATPDGRIWVAEEHGQALGVFDPATGRYRRYPVPGADPAPLGLAADAQGRLWFTAMNGDWIGRLDPASGRFTRYDLPTRAALPYWLAPAADGDVWFTEFGAARLGRLDPRTGAIREYPLPAGSNPAGIAIDSHGTVWAATVQGLLARVDPRTGQVRTVRVPVGDDYGVAVDPAGAVWLGSATGSAVYSYDPATGRFTAHAVPGGGSPWWVVTGGGRIWAAVSGSGANALAALDGGGR